MPQRLRCCRRAGGGTLNRTTTGFRPLLLLLSPQPPPPPPPPLLDGETLGNGVGPGRRVYGEQSLNVEPPVASQNVRPGRRLADGGAGKGAGSRPVGLRRVCVLWVPQRDNEAAECLD